MVGGPVYKNVHDGLMKCKKCVSEPVCKVHLYNRFLPSLLTCRRCFAFGSWQSEVNVFVCSDGKKKQSVGGRVGRLFDTNVFIKVEGSFGSDPRLSLEKARHPPGCTYWIIDNLFFFHRLLPLLCVSMSLSVL